MSGSDCALYFTGQLGGWITEARGPQSRERGRGVALGQPRQFPSTALLLHGLHDIGGHAKTFLEESLDLQGLRVLGVHSLWDLKWTEEGVKLFSTVPEVRHEGQRPFRSPYPARVDHAELVGGDIPQHGRGLRSPAAELTVE